MLFMRVICCSRTLLLSISSTSTSSCLSRRYLFTPTIVSAHQRNKHTQQFIIILRCGTCQHNYAVQMIGLVVGFCAQPLYCNWLYYLTTRFSSLSSHVVSAQPFPDRPRPMSTLNIHSHSVTRSTDNILPCTKPLILFSHCNFIRYMYVRRCTQLTAYMA